MKNLYQLVVGLFLLLFSSLQAQNTGNIELILNEEQEFCYMCDHPEIFYDLETIKDTSIASDISEAMTNADVLSLVGIAVKLDFYHNSVQNILDSVQVTELVIRASDFLVKRKSYNETLTLIVAHAAKKFDLKPQIEAIENYQASAAANGFGEIKGEASVEINNKSSNFCTVIIDGEKAGTVKAETTGQFKVKAGAGNVQIITSKGKYYSSAFLLKDGSKGVLTVTN